MLALLLAIAALVAFIMSLANVASKVNLVSVGGVLLSIAVIVQTGVLARLA